MKHIIFSVMACLAFALSTNVWADEDGSYTSYDEIVNQLKASADAPSRPAVEVYQWDDVALHGGVGLATSWVSPQTPTGGPASGLLKGVEFNVGMNLFTRQLRAEGAFSTYTQSELNAENKADLQEFELRLIFMPKIQDNLSLRVGMGLTTRYMTLAALTGNQWQNYSASTPGSLLLLGFERKISQNIALGPDIAYHSAFVSDTFDKTAVNASFHLNATF